MQNETYKFQEAERIMMAAIRTAIQQAAEHAADELGSLGVNKPARAYFEEAALLHLFSNRCGADTETNTGGDPVLAWDMLYVARSLARHWERASPVSRRKKKDSRRDIEKDKDEEANLARSAELFAIKTAVQALIGTASDTDPGIRERIIASVESHVEGLERQSEAYRLFAPKAKSTAASLVRYPAEKS